MNFFVAILKNSFEKTFEGFWVEDHQHKNLVSSGLFSLKYALSPACDLHASKSSKLIAHFYL